MIKKVTKSEAAYQDSPKATQRCGGCSMFREPDGCTKVVGEISPTGWCKFWEKKK